MVFQDPALTDLQIEMGCDVGPDGRVLVRTLPEDPNRAREIVVAQSWFEEVKALTRTR
jgi:hypothetical protein